MTKNLRSNKKWTNTEVHDLITYKANGKSDYMIARTLHRTEKAISVKLSVLRKNHVVKTKNTESEDFTKRLLKRRVEISKQEEMEKTIAKLTWVIWIGAVCGVFWIGTMIGRIL